MRTTVNVNDHVLSSAKRRAGALGLTLGELVERALREELARNERAAVGPPVPIFSAGEGLRSGVDATSTRALLEALDEDRPLEHLR
jgi:hypothetical protein